MTGMIHTPRFSTLGIPWLVSLWAMQGNARDSANLGNDNHLTETGVTKNSFEEIAYFDFDGTGDRLTVADNSSLDITGDLTAHGWVYFNNVPGSSEAIFGKWRTDNDNRSYRSVRGVNGKIAVQITRLGTVATINSLESTSVVGTGVWVFWCMLFRPNTSLTIYIGDNAGLLEKRTTTTSIESAIFNSSTQLVFGQTQTGASSYTNDLDGRQTRVGLHNGGLSEKSIYALYIQGLELFGLF